MRLSFAETSLQALDALEGVEAVGLFVFEDQRPLRGLAGFVDWRLCGGLSRILEEGRFVGTLGDALLFPAGGRLRGSRVFCFGAGALAALDRAGFEALVRRASDALTRAGCLSFAVELPPVPGLDEVERARRFIADGVVRFRGDRVVLMGHARSLAKAFSEAGELMKGLELDRTPLGSRVVTGSASKSSASKGAHAG